jgi:hypothetical protein
VRKHLACSLRAQQRKPPWRGNSLKIKKFSREEMERKKELLEQENDFLEVENI